MARQSKKIVANVSEEQLHDAMAHYATVTAKHEKLTAQLDAELTKIREKYAQELKDIELQKETDFEVIQAYAVENRERVFVSKKSLDLTHGTIGFRTANPSLKPLKGYTWNAVDKLLQEFAPEFVRTKTEPDKELLLAKRNEEGSKELFEKIGVYVEQKETFYIDLKTEKID